MRRAPGWITLAGIGLEMAILAFLSHVFDTPDEASKRYNAPHAASRVDDEPHAGPQTDPVARPDTQSAEQTAIEFITDASDPQARYYRASDDRGAEMFAAFFSDGRVRLANAQLRYAGMVINGHADLLDTANNAWSELFLSVTPAGRTQLELRGGPYDTHVLACEPFSLG